MPVIATQQEEEYFSSSSRDSTRNSASTTNSVASSATSTSSVFNERIGIKQTPANFPNFSKPTKAAKKERPALDISLPYSCNVDNNAEEIKTAKNLIPTWRYEDLSTDNQLPTPVTTMSAAHTRNQSWGHSRKTSFGTIFRRKNASTTGF
ncbi:hypothetical protein SLS60_004773 [Paraconiothyrium brasiliense]|uniref:Uncharacterized protein n=1 Tax=Paraconiothyrium brasiliense TaxID=300254 RepID=A0ABR3RLC4_9PLEO